MNKEDGMRFIPQAELKSRVVYRHPNGRFDVIERCGIGVLGIPYRICEAVLTPERDKRGIACKRRCRIRDLPYENPQPANTRTSASVPGKPK